MNYKTLNTQPPALATYKLVLILNNSKYSYAQFRYFHETVLTLLNYDNLVAFTEKQKKSTLFFIDIIVSLLDAPKRSIEPSPRAAYRKPEPDAPASFQSTADKRENLLRLLDWIERLVSKREITIEAMLDEFFKLNISCGTVNA